MQCCCVERSCSTRALKAVTTLRPPYPNFPYLCPYLITWNVGYADKPACSTTAGRRRQVPSLLRTSCVTQMSPNNHVRSGSMTKESSEQPAMRLLNCQARSYITFSALCCQSGGLSSLSCLCRGGCCGIMSSPAQTARALRYLACNNAVQALNSFGVLWQQFRTHSHRAASVLRWTELPVRLYRHNCYGTRRLWLTALIRAQSASACRPEHNDRVAHIDVFGPNGAYGRGETASRSITGTLHRESSLSYQGL